VLNVTTNEIAICRYNTTNEAWENMTQLDNTNSTAHNLSISGLSDGSSYSYYFMCEDSSNNRDGNYHLQFSVSSMYCGDGSCNNGETCSTCSADCGSCGGSGGGGGGSRRIVNNTLQNTTNISQPVSPSQQLVGCAENWNCGDWTECTTEGIKVRACNDANSCGTAISKPSEIQSCTKPTCSDNIQNQDELGIDCGGQCPKRCGVGELSGKIVQVPSPEKSAKSKYGIVLIFLLFGLIGMLTVITRIENRVKGNIRKSHILTHLHEHHHGTQVSPEASHIKDIGKSRLKLLLANIAHIIIIIVIIAVIYYLIK
jgi:hypothetical protein